MFTRQAGGGWRKLLGSSMTTRTTTRFGLRIALAAVLVCLVIATAYAFSIWNFFNVAVGRVSPYSIFREHDALRRTQTVIAALLVPGVLLYGWLRGILPAWLRWACFLVLAIAAAHLAADGILCLLH
jgi:hypothetical protein